MKIAYCTFGKAGDIRAWSGLDYHIVKSLGMQENVEVVYIDELSTKRNKNLQIVEKILVKLVRIFTGKIYDSGRTISLAKFYAKQIEKRIPSDVDVVFAPTSILMTYLKTDKIKVFYTDAEFVGMLNYYDSFANLSPLTISQGVKIEEDAINNCDLVLYASDWAANGAKKNYKITNPEKIKVVPFGANMEFVERTENEVLQIVESKDTNICNLLLVGVEWKRKGCDLAVKIAKLLHERGVKVRLDIVGIKNPPIELPEYIVSHGFVSKATQDGKNKINNLFENAHFFILPTQAECFGVVYSEAASFALPSLTTNTGGVPTAVKDGVNGKIFELSANENEYADFIEKMLISPEEYRKFCVSSYNYYKTQLNWNVAGKNIVGYMRELGKQICE